MATLQHARLFRGPDHLLQIASTGFSETYRRFYFRDIQAITIQKTHWGKIWNGVWGFFVALFGLPSIDMSGTPAIIMGSIAGFFGCFLIGNLVLGPTCACYIRTAIQTERLAPVTRIRTARRFLRRVRPLIDPLQGSIAHEELLVRLRAAPAGSVSPAGEIGSLASPPVISQPTSEPPVISTQTGMTAPESGQESSFA